MRERSNRGIHRRGVLGFQNVKIVNGTVILWFSTILIQDHGMLFARAFDSRLAKDNLPC